MKKLFALVPALLFTLTVNADTGSRWYGGLEYGSTELEDNTDAVASELVSILGGAVSVSQDSTVSVGRVFIGYRLTEQFAGEAGYFQSAKAGLRAAGVTGDGDAYTGRSDAEIDGFDVSALWFPMASKLGDAGLFFKAGFHQSKIDTKVTLSGAGGTESVSADESGNGTLIGIGYDWQFSDSAFARIAATRYFRLGGESDGNATVYSLAIGANF